MDVEEKSIRKNKKLYKVFLLLVKYIPILMAGCYVLNTVSCRFGLDLPVFSHIAGVSLCTWIFMYIAEVLFRFCIYHKMFLYYILVADIVNIIDYYIGIPIETSDLLAIHFWITGIFLFIILYLYVKYNKKVFSKIFRRYRFRKLKYFRRRRRRDYRNNKEVIRQKVK